MSDGPSSRPGIKLSIDISIESELWSSFATFAEPAETAIAEAIRQSGVRLRPGAEVSILLCDDRFIRALNIEWRGCDAATNVLSFPAPGDVETSRSLGDIAIAYETTAREAEEEGKRFKDHVMHLLVHGFLHLVGYDHQNEAEAADMERLERDILAALGIDDPYRTALVGISE
jgi:probable rRNA maturation factor